LLLDQQLRFGQRLLGAAFAVDGEPRIACGADLAAALRRRERHHVRGAEPEQVRLLAERDAVINHHREPGAARLLRAALRRQRHHRERRLRHLASPLGLRRF
jgi:hypothetical protein